LVVIVYGQARFVLFPDTKTLAECLRLGDEVIKLITNAWIEILDEQISTVVAVLLFILAYLNALVTFMARLRLSRSN
jgi:hypothetical protein